MQRNRVELQADPAQAIGEARISKNRGVGLCRGWTAQVNACHCRPLKGERLYLWLECQGRQAALLQARAPNPKALEIACSIHETGRRGVIWLDIGEIEPGRLG